MGIAFGKLIRAKGLPLQRKLLLALGGVSLLCVVIAGLAYYISSGPAFQQLIIDQGEEGFVGNVTLYYRETGTLHGFASWLPARVNEPPEGSAAVHPGDPRPGGLVRYGLADDFGVVVLPGGTGFLPDQPVPVGVLKQGRPIYVDGRFVGTALVPANDPVPRTGAQDAYIRRINIALALAACLGMLMAIGVSFILTNRIAAPLRLFTAAAHEVAGGKIPQPIQVTNNDELGRLAQAINTMGAELQRHEQARRQMAADIVHELRTPLTTINGYVEAMRDGDLAPTVERLDSVYHQTQRLATVIDDLRLLALADVGGLPLTVGPVAIQRIIAQSVQAHAIRAAQRGIALRAEVGDPLPVVQADPIRLQQVIEILITNALRHTDKGEVVVSGAAETAAAIIKVADTGCGIEPEALPRLFERFYRGEGARDKDAQGSGLGLAIAKAIVNAHKGTIAVTSKLREGTVFTIRLPLGPVSAAST